MGLDMYAKVTAKRPPQDVDFFVENEQRCDDDLHYWRKHPNLHGWMEALYRKKGGQGEPGMDGDDTFNLVPVVIDAADLDQLEKDLAGGGLPETVGFFFGQSQPEDIESDREFITKARAAIAAGKTVYYFAWW